MALHSNYWMWSHLFPANCLIRIFVFQFLAFIPSPSQVHTPHTHTHTHTYAHTQDQLLLLISLMLFIAPIFWVSQIQTCTIPDSFLSIMKLLSRALHDVVTVAQAFWHGFLLWVMTFFFNLLWIKPNTSLIVLILCIKYSGTTPWSFSVI